MMLVVEPTSWALMSLELRRHGQDWLTFTTTIQALDTAGGKGGNGRDELDAMPAAYNLAPHKTASAPRNRLGTDDAPSIPNCADTMEEMAGRPRLL